MNFINKNVSLYTIKTFNHKTVVFVNILKNAKSEHMNKLLQRHEDRLTDSDL